MKCVYHTNGKHGTVGVHPTLVLIVCAIWHCGSAYHTYSNGVLYATLGVLIAQIKFSAVYMSNIVPYFYSVDIATYRKLVTQVYIANCYDVDMHIVTQNSIDSVAEKTCFIDHTDLQLFAIVYWRFSPIKLINIRRVATYIIMFNKQF